MKRDVTRYGKRTKRGAIADGMNSAKRYFINKYQDYRRQEGLDIVIGLTTGTGKRIKGSSSRKLDVLKEKLKSFSSSPRSQSNSNTIANSKGDSGRKVEADLEQVFNTLLVNENSEIAEEVLSQIENNGYEAAEKYYKSIKSAEAAVDSTLKDILSAIESTKSTEPTLEQPATLANLPLREEEEIIISDVSLSDSTLQNGVMSTKNKGTSASGIFKTVLFLFFACIVMPWRSVSSLLK